MNRKSFYILLSLFVFFAFLTGSTYAHAESVQHVAAQSMVVMDYESGTIVCEKDITKRLPIASMTKIMLLDLIFEQVENGVIALDEEITVSKTASGMGGSQVFLQADGKYKCSDLIKSIIVASANDASVAMAERLYSSEAECVNAMNKKAREMGLNNTLFSNCTGLTRPTQYSCAIDVAKMLKSLLRHDDYYRYSTIWLDEIAHPDGSKTQITNTNKMVKFYEGCDGGKTGFTNESKYCLACTAKRGDTRLITVVIGEENSKTRFKEVSELFSSTFNNYTSKIVVDKRCALDEKIQVKGGKEEYVEVFPERNLTIFCSNNEEVNYSIKVEKETFAIAPMKKGDKVGSVVLYRDGVEYSRTDAVIGSDVYAADFGDSFNKVTDNW